MTDEIAQLEAAYTKLMAATDLIYEQLKQNPNDSDLIAKHYEATYQELDALIAWQNAQGFDPENPVY